MPNMLGAKTFDAQISALKQDQARYDNYPAFQRGRVWPMTMKQLLIDSILRDYPIGEILVYFDEELGNYQTIDGQQRLTTIFSFMDGDFATISKTTLDDIEPQPIELIDPGKKWHLLSRKSRQQIENYSIHFLKIDKRNEVELGVMFRRLQMEVALSMGEKLSSYSSEAKRIADNLAHHHFFTAVYTGDKKHRQSFHMGLYLLEITRSSFPLALEKKVLSQLTSGRYDKELTEEMIQTIMRRLDQMALLFLGSSMKAKTDIIAMYEALLKLETAGYDVDACKTGCLKDWFLKAKHAPLYGISTWGNLNTFAQLSHKRVQELLWMRQERDLFQQPGLIKHEQARLAGE
jgi:hypothetical protein